MKGLRDKLAAETGGNVMVRELSCMHCMHVCMGRAPAAGITSGRRAILQLVPETFSLSSLSQKLLPVCIAAPQVYNAKQGYNLNVDPKTFMVSAQPFPEHPGAGAQSAHGPSP